jgi:CBS domain containing-hemolysin-like protein
VARVTGSSLSEDDRTVTRQELRLLLETTRAPNLTADDRQLIRRVFAFNEATVEDAMVPLIEVVAVSRDATIAEAARRMVETGHSRLPLYDGRVDRICAIVLHQELLTTDDWDAPVSTVSRDPYFVPETKRADELLLEMRRQRQRMAVVVDEYGGAVGIITAEDILEEIVGEIEDESDRARPLVRRVGEREWLASGRAEREHIQHACGLALPDGDFETIAGFVLAQLGRVPVAGESVQIGAFALVVAKASDRAVLEVKIRGDGR